MHLSGMVMPVAQTRNVASLKPLRTEPFPPWPHFPEEVMEAALAPLKKGRPNYWGGTFGVEFQERFAEYCGVKHGIAVNSGTSALHAALGALGVGPGDEVITPCYTFIASAMCVLHQNAIPVFADVDPITHCIALESIVEKLTSRTRVILPVHLYGHPADMDPIMEIAEAHGLKVVEDCAQALGAKYKGRPLGSIGHINAFSFCQDKTFTTGGEGGMIVTDDDELSERARSLKDHGYPDGERRRLFEQGSLYLYTHRSIGFNYRMTEMQAAMGIEELKRLDSWHLPRRARNAEALSAELENAPAIRRPSVQAGCTHAWYKYPITLELEQLTCDRDEFVRTVREMGYPGCTIGDSPENYVEDVFREHAGYGSDGCPFCCPHNGEPIDYREVHCPVAADLGKRTVKLQVHPTMEPEDARDIGRIVRAVAEHYLA